MRYRSLLLSALLGLLIVFSCCCSNIQTAPSTKVTEDQTIQIRMVVGLDFGKQVLLDDVLEVKAGTSALEALIQVADITTAYGGGFVTSIQGIKSGYIQQPSSRNDWFLYINGLLSNTGGLSYSLYDGDIVFWNYMNWNFRQSVTALAGDIPHYLIYGYGGKVKPTIIVYEQHYQQLAQELASSLSAQTVADVSIRSYPEISQSEKENSNLIIIGDHDFEPVALSYSIWDRVGLFCRYHNNMLEVYDTNGNMSASYQSKAGVIQALQNPYNPRGTRACQNVMYVISGTDSQGIAAAVNLLITQPAGIELLAGCVVYQQVVFPLPY